MLSKKYRLKSNSSFKATYCQNRVVSDEFFTLFAGKNKSNPDLNTRAGFVVSKKVHKRAVVRNKIKRRLREAFYRYLKEYNPSFISVIFKARENSVNSNYEDTLKSVYNLMNKIANKNF